jgi:hypothetical protein
MSWVKVETLNVLFAGDPKISPDVFSPGDAERGAVFMPAGTIQGTLFSWQVSADKLVWSSLRDASGAAVASHTFVASVNIFLPVQLFAHKYARLVMTTDQTANRVFKVSLAGN